MNPTQSKGRPIVIWEEKGAGRITVNSEAFVQFAVDLNRSLAELERRNPRPMWHAVLAERKHSPRWQLSSKLQAPKAAGS
jgi:hypothetical protein